MRLIDADELMEYCLNLKEKKVDCNDIARFPTAYNVDEVVEELEEDKVFVCKLLQIMKQCAEAGTDNCNLSFEVCEYKIKCNITFENPKLIGEE